MYYPANIGSPPDYEEYNLKWKESFVSPYEEQFMDYYNKYFSQYDIVDRLLIINQRIPMATSSFIYWLLQQENLIGYRNNNSTQQLLIENNNINIKTTLRFVYLGTERVDIMTVNHECKLPAIISLDSLNCLYAKTGDQYLDERSSQTNMNTKQRQRLKSQPINNIGYFHQVVLLEDERFPKMEVYYNMAGLPIQDTSICLYIPPEIEDRISFIETMSKALRLLILPDFVIISKEEIGISVYCQINIRIYSRLYYEKLIGCEMDILNAYLGSCRNMLGFHKWAAEKWNVHEGDLGLQVKRKILEYALDDQRLEEFD